MTTSAGIQAELDRLVDGGLPGAFVYREDADGESEFQTAGVADLATTFTPELRSSLYCAGGASI